MIWKAVDGCHVGCRAVPLHLRERQALAVRGQAEVGSLAAQSVGLELPELERHVILLLWTSSCTATMNPRPKSSEVVSLARRTLLRSDKRSLNRLKFVQSEGMGYQAVLQSDVKTGLYGCLGLTKGAGGRFLRG